MTLSRVYYANKLESLRSLFGTDEVALENDSVLRIGDCLLPIVDDVIILLDPGQYPQGLHNRLQGRQYASPYNSPAFAGDIQFTFGEEWKAYNRMLPEHEAEFHAYFDIVDLEGLRGKRVCDLGCGIGRWAYFLREWAAEIVLVDFSEAIFEARSNLADDDHALFFMADLKQLPFARDSVDFIYCLGVLHHLPTPALDSVRALGYFAPTLLIYLYYALDNRPPYFRTLLSWVTGLRQVLARIRNGTIRAGMTEWMVWSIYLPLIGLGHVFTPMGLGPQVPLYEGYRGKGLSRIRQDVYDRFFTRIEQRVSRDEILALRDSFSEVVISDGLPYWHFVCRR